MRIAPDRDPFGFVGDELRLEFSQREKATMLAASRIAEEARRRCREEIGPDFVDSDEDYQLAELEHAHVDVIDGLDLGPRR